MTVKISRGLCVLLNVCLDFQRALWGVESISEKATIIVKKYTIVENSNCTNELIHQKFYYTPIEFLIYHPRNERRNAQDGTRFLFNNRGYEIEIWKVSLAIGQADQDIPARTNKTIGDCYAPVVT